jgi:hypothetical protein
MPRSKVIMGTGNQPCALFVSNNPRAFLPKTKKPIATPEERKAKARKRKLHKHVYGETSQHRRQANANVRKRNARLAKEVHAYAERHDLFLTLRSPFKTNDPAGVVRFKEVLAKFRAAYLYKFKLSNGAALFWLEKSNKLMIHAHMLCYTKSDITAEELEAWATRTWSRILKKILARYDRFPTSETFSAGLATVTPYHEAQLGYFAKGTKAKDSLVMLIAADGLATFGVWNKAGLTPAEVRANDITDEDKTEVQREAMIFMYDEAHRLGRPVNRVQEARILSGDFGILYMTKDRLLALNARCGGRLLKVTPVGTKAQAQAYRTRAVA